MTWEPSRSLSWPSLSDVRRLRVSSLDRRCGYGRSRAWACLRDQSRTGMTELAVQVADCVRSPTHSLTVQVLMSDSYRTFQLLGGVPSLLEGAEGQAPDAQVGPHFLAFFRPEIPTSTELLPGPVGLLAGSLPPPPAGQNIFFVDPPFKIIPLGPSSTTTPSLQQQHHKTHLSWTRPAFFSLRAFASTSAHYYISSSVLSASSASSPYPDQLLNPTNARRILEF